MKKITLFLIAFCFVTFGFSQVDCASALTLTPGTPQAGDTTGQSGSFSDSNTPPEVNPCSSNYNDLEYWFKYTATADGETLDITVTDLTTNYYGVFIIDNCPDSTPTCIASDTNGFSSADLAVTTPALTAGTTYYIVMTDWIEGPTTFTMNSTVIAAPTCPDPSGMTATSVTDTTADLTWTAGGSEGLWNLAWNGGADFDPLVDTPEGSATGLTSTMYNATGLTANTTYYIYYQADCTGGDTSDWVGPFVGTTLCAVETPDYTEDFTTFLNPCWEEAADGDLTAGPASFGSANWLAEEFAHLTSSGLGAVNINMYLSSDVEWLISPEFDLSTGGYELLVDVALTNYNSTTAGTFDPNDEVRLVYSSDGTNWTTLTTWNQANTPSASGETVITDISALTGSNVQFAFYAVEDSAASSRDIDFHLDNFKVRTPPSCLEPSNLTLDAVTQTTADVSWTLGDTETDWDLVYGTPGFDPDTEGTLVDVSTTSSYSITGLTANTTYEVYVRADCGGSTSIWIGPISVSTLCNAFSVPFTEGFNSDSTTQNCWTVLNENGDGDSWNLDYSTNPFEGDQVAMMYTDFNSGNNDDWLISPGITLTGAERLKFQSRVQSSGEPNDFEVLLSTTGTTPADFTTTLLANSSYSNTTYQEFTIDLTAYSGVVYLAWHIPNGGLDGWRLYIDEVIVEVQPTDTPDWYNIQWITDGVNGSDTSLTVDAWSTITGYAQVYEAGITDPAGQAAGIECWFGATNTDSDPSTWAENDWIPATYLGDVGNNDEYTLDVDVDFVGTIYVATRWRYNGGPYVYGGFNGPWDGTTNNSIELISNPIVANDICSSATALTVNADLACGTVTPGTTLDATESFDDSTTCFGNNNDDVWYSFVATSTSHAIEISNVVAVSGTSVDMYFEVLDGSCGSLTSLLCSDPNTNTVSGLTISNTYLIRVYSYYDTSSQTFDICVGTPPPPPANDDCSGAEALSFGVMASGTTSNATGASSTSCDGTIGNDVWYTIVGDGSDITITVDAVSVDQQIGIFESADCSGITLGSCDFSADGFTNPESVTFTSTNGAKYYIQVGAWSSSSGASDFSITAGSTLGIGDFEQNSFTYFPNPVTNNLTLRAQKDIQTIAVYNMLGQEVLRTAPNAVDSTVDMSTLNSGAYFVRVTIDNISETIRIIKN